MRGIWRDPVTVFFVAGGALFICYKLLANNSANEIRLDDATLALLINDYEVVTGHAVDEAMRQTLIDDYYRRELLFREAVRAGLHLQDGELRESLIRLMQQQVSGVLPEPDDTDLVSYYTGHMERYYAEATISFEQVFFAQAPEDGAAVRSRLEAGETVTGDVPPWGAVYPQYGESMVQGLFGKAMLERLRTQELDRWSGPWESAKGWHFVRVTQREPARPLPFAAVREQVRHDLQVQALDERVDAFVQARASVYPLVMDTAEDAPK